MLFINSSKDAGFPVSEIIPRELLFSHGVKFNPKISPDGTKLTYLSPVNNIMNLWFRTVGKNDDRAITFFEKRCLNYYTWAGNKYIVYIQDLDGKENWLLYKLNIETGDITTLTPWNNIKIRFFYCNTCRFPDRFITSINKDNSAVHDLYHIDLKTNELTLMEKNPGNITDWLIDYNLKLKGIILMREDGGTDFMVRDDEGSPWKLLVSWDMEDSAMSRPISFSKDNNYVYILDSSCTNTSQVVRMELKSGKKEIIACHTDYDIYMGPFNPGNYRVDGNPIIINPKTFEIQAVSFNKYRKEWIILDETMREDFEEIKKFDRGDFAIVDRNDRDEIWLIAFEYDNRPESYYIYNRISKKGSFLFDGNPLLNKYVMSSVEEMEFVSRDGLNIKGYITYPPGEKRKNLPMVLFVHGGPWFRDEWVFNPVVQWLSNRGYVCLQVNYRGSSGYGKDFLNAGNKEWGGKMQDDLTDAVRWAVDNGIAEPKKIAVYGSGYGGYAALVGAIFTPELFSCAVAIQSPGNLVTFLQAIPGYWNRNKFFKRVGDPDIDGELLISRSPFYNLDHIKIPLLVAYGMKSPRVKPSEPYKIVSTLRSKGIEVEQLVFPDEGHDIVKPENRMKFYGVAERFLSKYLGGRYESSKIHVKEIYISKDRKFQDRIEIDKILKEGDKRAFEILLSGYEKPLLKHLFNLTGDFKVSKDLLHETFSRVWFYLDSYSPHMPFSPWIFKVATNVANKYIKEIKSFNETYIDELELDIISGEWQEDVENKIFLTSVLHNLKEPYRTALVLRFIEEMDYKEIATIMNTNINQIKTYLFRAKKFFLKSCIIKNL